MKRSLQVGCATHVGRVRSNNEDSALITDLSQPCERLCGMTGTMEVGPRGNLLAVADGMGGHAAGEVASALAVRILFEALTWTAARGSSPVAERLLAAIREADRRVRAAATEGGREGMATTLTAVFVIGTEAYIAEIGDSRAYLLRGGRLRQLTRDQTLVQALVDDGAISPGEARSSGLRNLVLEAIGSEHAVAPTLSRLALRRSDGLLLCSDGLSGQVSDPELREILEQSPTPAAACQSLVAAANAAGGEDNITAIVAVLEGEGWPERPSAESIEDTLTPLTTGEHRNEPGEASGSGDPLDS